MTSDKKPVARITIMETHLQTVLTSVITATLLWVGITVHKSREDLVRLEEKLSSMNNRISTLDLRLIEFQKESYTRTEAAKDFAYVDLKVKQMLNRIETLERINNVSQGK